MTECCAQLSLLCGRSRQLFEICAIWQVSNKACTFTVQTVICVSCLQFFLQINGCWWWCVLSNTSLSLLYSHTKSTSYNLAACLACISQTSAAALCIAALLYHSVWNCLYLQDEGTGLSRCWQPLSQQHSVTSQETWTFRNAAVRTSDLAICLPLEPQILKFARHKTAIRTSDLAICSPYARLLWERQILQFARHKQT
jgi:hypothetical protein